MFRGIMKLLCRNAASRVACVPVAAHCRVLSTTSQTLRVPKRLANGNHANFFQPFDEHVSVKGRQSPKSLKKLESRTRIDSVSQGHDPKSRLRLAMREHYRGKHAVFRSAVLHRFEVVLRNLSKAQTPEADSNLHVDKINQQAALFMDAIDHAFLLAEKNVKRRDKNPMFWSLREAFISRDVKGLTRELWYMFQSFMVRQRFSKGLEESQQRLLDFRFPFEWFPATRTMQRTIHVHVGPTNSGKTYNALKALENSKNGVYAGPLRLLATEVYQRLNAKGKPCALITGEEVRVPENTDQYFTSCTVEMIPLNSKVDVAVIDEIQMIADSERGNAWTMALLGVQAKEVHLCGEDRTVNLIQAICASIGDKCVVHRYERLSPLETMNSAIDGDYNKLQKGDAIVAFNRLALHMMKRNIELKTGRRCAIIYGSLPPEVRVQQAALFNDPDNDYDFVVASDAIGMGLNLEIRRVILESVAKFDGNHNRLLTYPEIKQIGGRAGRYRTAQNTETPEDGADTKKVGLVTTMEQIDLQSVRRAFQKQVEDITCASIQPPAGVVEQFASYFPPETPLSFILMRIQAAALVGPRYSLDLSNDALEVADTIQDLPLTIYDRLTFCYMPVVLRADGAVEVVRALARVVANNLPGNLLDIKEIPLEYLDVSLEDFEGTSQQYLRRLEFLHTAINQYVWLSYRYAGMFRSQKMAFHVRRMVEEKLIYTLDRLNFTDADLDMRRKAQRLQVQHAKAQSVRMNQELMARDEGGELISDSPE